MIAKRLLGLPGERFHDVSGAGSALLHRHLPCWRKGLSLLLRLEIGAVAYYVDAGHLRSLEVLLYDNTAIVALLQRELCHCAHWFHPRYPNSCKAGDDATILYLDALGPGL